MYPEQEEDSKTIPLQPADNGNISSAPAQNINQNTTPVQNTYQNYNAAGSQNMYQNYNQNAAGGQNMYQGYNAAPNQNMYQNYNAAGTQGMYQNYNAAPNPNMNQNYNAPQGQNMYQNYNTAQGQNMGYAQQNFQNQNPYYVNSAAQAPNAAAPKKKSKLPLIILLIVILVAAIGTGVFFFLKKNKASGSPKETVANAVSQTFSSDAPSALSSYLGSDELVTMTLSGAYQEAFSLTITDIGGSSMPYEAYLLNGLGISGNTAIDAGKKQMASSIDITYGGISYLNCNLFAYDDFMALALPDFFDGYLEINTTTMSTDYANSYLATLLGSDFSIPADYAFNFFDAMQSSSTATVPDELNEFMESIEYTKGETTEIEINGKSQSCQGYQVTITKTAMEKLLDLFYNYAAQSNVDLSRSDLDAVLTFPENGITFTVYVDNKGRMVQLAYKDSISADGTTLDMDAQISFLGADRPTDKVSGQINMAANGYTACISIESNTTNNGSSSATDTVLGITADGSYIGSLTYNNTLDTATGASSFSLSIDGMGENYLSVTMDGTYNNVVAGKSMHYDINDLTINVMSGAYTVSLSGSISLEPVSGSVDQPSGTRYDLFNMTEADFNTLGAEIMTNLYNSPIASLLIGMYQN